MAGLFKTVLKLSVTAAILVFIIWKLGWSTITTTLETAQLHWLGAGLVLFTASCWLGAAQWQLLLRNKNIVQPISRTLALYFIGLFFNNFALGALTGDAIKVAYLKKSNTSGKPGFAATFLDRFAGLWAMLGFAVVGSILLLKQKAVESQNMILAAIALFVTFILFCGILAFLVSPQLQKGFDTLLDRVPLWKKDFIRKVISETIIESHQYRLILPVALMSALVQFSRIIVHILCAAALGILTPGNVHYFFIFVPILAMLMIIPLPLGVREGAGGALFAMAGFQPHTALIMGFLSTILGIVASLPGGVLFIIERSNRRENA